MKNITKTKISILMKKIVNFNSIMIIIMATFMAVSLPSCKTKKKVTPKREVKPRVNPNIAKAKTKLSNLLNDESITLEELERELANIKKMNLNDPNVKQLISKVESKIKARHEAAKVERKKEYSLAEYFSLISSAASTGDANNKIQDALKLCSNRNVPVLIIIAEDGGMTDYDEPTTVEKYLNYLKDVKKNPNKIKNLKFNSANKITEIELIKK